MRTLCLLFAMALVGAPVMAQDIPDPPEGDQEMIQVESTWPETVSPDLFRVNQRPPIPFEPLPRLDPATGKPITPEALLTLPDGRVVKANAYYDELDRFESNLNQLGYSLRDPEPEVELEGPVIDEEDLHRAQAELDRMKPRPGRVEAEYLERMGRKPLQNLSWADCSSGSGTRTCPFEWHAGDKDLFAVSLNGQITLSGRSSTAALSADAMVEAFALGESHRAEILRLETSMTVPETGAKSASLRLNVHGKTAAVDWKEEKSEPFFRGGSKATFSKTIDYPGVTYVLPFLGYNIKVRAGFAGSVKLYYEVSALSSPPTATAQFKPSVNTRVYVQAGLNVYVAEVGAGASLTLLAVDLDLYGSSRMNGLRPTVMTYCDYDLMALRGKAYVYLYIGFPPFQKRYKKTLWKWDGIAGSGSFFDHSWGPI